MGPGWVHSQKSEADLWLEQIEQSGVMDGHHWDLVLNITAVVQGNALFRRTQLDES